MGASGTLSHGNLEKKVGTSGDIIGRYERDEVMPSAEVASRGQKQVFLVLDTLIRDYKARKTYAQ